MKCPIINSWHYSQFYHLLTKHSKQTMIPRKISCLVKYPLEFISRSSFCSNHFGLDRWIERLTSHLLSCNPNNFIGTIQLDANGIAVLFPMQVIVLLDLSVDCLLGMSFQCAVNVGIDFARHNIIINPPPSTLKLRGVRLGDHHPTARRRVGGVAFRISRVIVKAAAFYGAVFGRCDRLGLGGRSSRRHLQSEYISLIADTQEAIWLWYFLSE